MPPEKGNVPIPARGWGISYRASPAKLLRLDLRFSIQSVEEHRQEVIGDRGLDYRLSV